jgi:hypothetical protein
VPFTNARVMPDGSLRPDDPAIDGIMDEGTGKSYIKLQLAVARALAMEWLGLLPDPGRTLVLSCEDDEDETQRRIDVREISLALVRFEAVEQFTDVFPRRLDGWPCASDA